MSCDLCRNPLPVIKKLYDETDEWIIIDCMNCEVPMVIWKDHTMTITEKENKKMEKVINAVGNKVFGKGNYYIDKKQRAVPDHLHWHARPKENNK